MCQGTEESNEAYVKRAQSNAQSLELVGGGHIFTSPELAQAADPDNVTNAEWKVEEEAFKKHPPP